MNLEEEHGIPFSALKFVISIINYGGRIIDNNDSILIEAIILSYLNDDLINNKQKLTEDPLFQFPMKFAFDDIQQNISQMPDFEDSEIYGLDKNANIIYNQKISEYLIFPLY